MHRFLSHERTVRHHITRLDLGGVLWLGLTAGLLAGGVSHLYAGPRLEPLGPEAAPGAAVARPGGPPAAGRTPAALLYLAETIDGHVVASHGADRLINAASLVKIATSLWALEKLGPQHRFTTRFEARGRVMAGRHLLDGDLLVRGGGDPDFHVENGYLVARALEAMGIRKISGRLLVSRTFWMGWENGVSEDSARAADRARLMAARLRRSFDARRWTKAERRAWSDFALDRRLGEAAQPHLQVMQKGGLLRDGAQGHLLLRHQSRTLRDILRRFNTWSNNDIQRLETSLGRAAALDRFLRQRWGLRGHELHLTSLSGLGENQVTLQLMLRLLADFRQTAGRLGLGVGDLLPTAGCGAGTLQRFEHLGGGEAATSVVGKTGTLTETGGGISLLAGYGRTAAGELLFCTAWPGSGHRPQRARRAAERWLLSLMSQAGGPLHRSCPPPPGRSDQGASILPGNIETSGTSPSPGGGPRGGLPPGTRWPVVSFSPWKVPVGEPWRSSPL